MNPFRYFHSTHRTGYRPMARPLLTRDSRAEKGVVIPALSGIRTNDPSVRVVQDHPYHQLHNHRNSHLYVLI